jgi:hypothetical protein
MNPFRTRAGIVDADSVTSTEIKYMPSHNAARGQTLDYLLVYSFPNYSHEERHKTQADAIKEQDAFYNHVISAK